MLNLWMAYICTKVNDGLLCCSPKPFVACAADLDMLPSFVVAMTGNSMHEPLRTSLRTHPSVLLQANRQ